MRGNKLKKKIVENINNNNSRYTYELVNKIVFKK